LLQNPDKEALNAQQASSIYVLDGEIRAISDDAIAARDQSTLFIAGGAVYAESGSGVLARNQSEVYFSGGSISGLGFIGENVPAYGGQSTHTASIYLSGGELISEFGSAAIASDASSWTISGGVLSAGGVAPALLLEENSRAFITGGVFQSSGEFAFELLGNAQVELRDGLLSGGIKASGASQIHVYGSGLSNAGGPLTGTLEGGAPLNLTYSLLDDAQLILHSLDVLGDTNGDRIVDLEDLNNVRNHFGDMGLGDANGDGLVDLQDLNAVRNNFGFDGTSQLAVPEPSSLTLFIAALGAVLFLRRWSTAG
jgi:hypothetical protein